MYLQHVTMGNNNAPTTVVNAHPPALPSLFFFVSLPLYSLLFLLHSLSILAHTLRPPFIFRARYRHRHALGRRLVLRNTGNHLPPPHNMSAVGPRKGRSLASSSSGLGQRRERGRGRNLMTDMEVRDRTVHSLLLLSLYHFLVSCTLHRSVTHLGVGVSEYVS